MSEGTVDSHNDMKPKKKNELWEWIKALLIAGILALLIRSFLFEPYVVNGSSMMPTLENNEKLIVNKLVHYMDEPERGEIVVFQATEQYKYIKRVIAVEGETVEVHDDHLYIDGERVSEPYLEQFKQRAHTQGEALTDEFGPVEVPEDEIFVMGDNRDHSQDSRYTGLGTVPESKVIGRASLVFWPLSHFRMLNHQKWENGSNTKSR